jgi:hypothetical protein
MHARGLIPSFQQLSSELMPPNMPFTTLHTRNILGPLHRALLLMTAHYFFTIPALLTSRRWSLLPALSTIGFLPSGHHRPQCLNSTTFPWCIHAKPKRGSVVDSYQTVTVNCNNCGAKLFRYKKKNGTKSSLVKLYIERISDDCAGLLQSRENEAPLLPQQQQQSTLWSCPDCQTNFARLAVIHGRPALKLQSGKIRMTRR